MNRAQKLISVVEGKPEANAKEKTIRMILDRNTKGVFHDDGWKPIHEIQKELVERGIDCYLMDAEYKKDKDGNQTGKDYLYKLPLGDKGGWHLRISCSFGPSRVGETDKYDINYSLSWDAKLTIDEKKKKCPECDGEGEVEKYCPHCNGSGEGHHEGQKCQHCKGGTIKKKCPECDGDDEESK